MAPQNTALGIDFGTSNSAAGYLQDGRPMLVEMAPDQNTLPTAFFFDFDTQKTLVGDPAAAALLNGDFGRFMRALKRVLGTSLMHEPRQILNRRVTFVDIIAQFLSHMKTKAERQAGHSFDKVVAGRPVVFHGDTDPREAQAEADLRACFEAAGFNEIVFLAEPEAAALATGAGSDGYGLIVDIGGGTSDFSLFRNSADDIQILANRGVRIGGTDFDKAISVDHVMPLLGKGTLLRDVMGDGMSTAPHAIFHKLATWEEIPFQYTAQSRRLAADMARQAVEPEKLKRLVAVLEDTLGHDLAFAVEAGKIAANGDAAQSIIELSVLERGLMAPLSNADLHESLECFGPKLRSGVAATIRGT